MTATARWLRLRALPHDEPQAGVDGVEVMEIPVASLPGAGIEILTCARVQVQVLPPQPC